jgi:hypothetical protein
VLELDDSTFFIMIHILARFLLCRLGQENDMAKIVQRRRRYFILGFCVFLYYIYPIAFSIFLTYYANLQSFVQSRRASAVVASDVARSVTAGNRRAFSSSGSKESEKRIHALRAMKIAMQCTLQRREPTPC